MFSHLKKLLVLGALCFLIGGFSHAFAAYTDTSFNPGTGPGGTNPFINTMAMQADGKIVLGGQFSTFNGTSRPGIVRLNVDGSVDTSFTPGAGVSPSSGRIAVQSDGKILVSGSFTTYDGTTRHGIARTNTDGTLDTSFDPGSGIGGGLGSIVLSIIPQSSGKILIAGNFATYNGTSRAGIARINTDGTLDTSFDPGTGASSVSEMVVQSDGKIIIVGGFTTYDGTSRAGIARVNTDGTLDTSFDPGSGVSGADSIVIQSNDKTIIAGSFTTYNGTSRKYIARINTNGTLDTSFDPGVGPDDTISRLALQTDGKIFIIGAFTTYDAVSNTVSVINTSTKAVTNTIAVGSEPDFSTLVGTNLFVLNYGSNSISVINTSTNTVSNTISVGSTPEHAILVGTDLYVANTGSGTVSVVDTGTKTVTATLATTKATSSFLVGTYLYVLRSDGYVSVVDTTTKTIIAVPNFSATTITPSLTKSSTTPPPVTVKTI